MGHQMGHYFALMGHHSAPMGHQMGHQSAEMGHEWTPRDTILTSVDVMVKRRARRGVSTRFSGVERPKKSGQVCQSGPDSVLRFSRVVVYFYQQVFSPARVATLRALQVHWGHLLFMPGGNLGHLTGGKPAKNIRDATASIARVESVRSDREQTSKEYECSFPILLESPTVADLLPECSHEAWARIR